MRQNVWAWIVVGLAGTLPSGAMAQHAGVGTPLQSSGSGTFNQTGVNWSLQGHGFWADFGGPAAIPQFGQPNASAGLQTGFKTSAGGWNFGLNAVAGQGSSSSASNVSPSVTTINGGGGYFIDATVSPFVIGMTPVVGGGFGPGVNFAPLNLPGSNVQLPTFSYFSVNTSVSVPDGGGALLGGMGGAGGGSNQFGPNRSMAGQTQAQQMQVHVQIHDMAELDAQVLAAAGPAKSAAPPMPRLGPACRPG